MARSPNEKVEKARKLYNCGMKMVDIASQLDCSAATIRTWKNRYKWDADGNETFQNESETKRNVSEETGEEKAVANEVKQVMQNTDLTDKQQLFCIYYIRCFNATKAYQKAYGCDYTTAMSEGSKCLRNPKIKAEIFRLKQERLNREFLSESDIFQKYMDIAFADINDFVDIGAGFVTAKDGIDGTIVSEVSNTQSGVKIKLADRMKALQWLTDHMDLATEKQKAEIALLKSRADAGKDDREDKLDKFFEQIEGALRDAE